LTPSPFGSDLRARKSTEKLKTTRPQIRSIRLDISTIKDFHQNSLRRMAHHQDAGHRQDHPNPIHEDGFSQGAGMNLHKKLATMAFVTLMSAFAASAADLTGTWNAEYDTPMGKMSSTFVFKQSGEKVTGKVLGEFGGEKHESELKEIKLQGATLSFVESVDMQGNTLNIDYTGTVAADEIKFSRKIGEFGNDEIVAKRAKAAAAAAPAPAAKK
jgi:hypothetical protein